MGPKNAEVVFLVLANKCILFIVQCDDVSYVTDDFSREILADDVYF